jgi:hypothetical protein
MASSARVAESRPRWVKVSRSAALVKQARSAPAMPLFGSMLIAPYKICPSHCRWAPRTRTDGPTAVHPIHPDGEEDRPHVMSGNALSPVRRSYRLSIGDPWFCLGAVTLPYPWAALSPAIRRFKLYCTTI